MSENKFPVGWDDAKVKRALSHYERQSPDDAVIEDEAGFKSGETVMNIPHDLVPAVRELIAKRHR